VARAEGALVSAWSHGLLDLLICAGLLVVMPLGLRLLAAPGVATVRRVWFAAVLTAGMWLVGWLSWRQARSGAAAGGLLVTSAFTLVATMLLALDWALGEAAGLPHLPLSLMVATHGLANALGFALCALVAWQRIAVEARWS
jgi:hypothetical protein